MSLAEARSRRQKRRNSMRGMTVRDMEVKSQFDKRTKVLHIVQDIGRPDDIGSADCEQWADVIMELFEPSPKSKVTK